MFQNHLVGLQDVQLLSPGCNVNNMQYVQGHNPKNTYNGCPVPCRCRSESGGQTQLCLHHDPSLRHVSPTTQVSNSSFQDHSLLQLLSHRRLFAVCDTFSFLTLSMQVGER